MNLSNILGRELTAAAPKHIAVQAEQVGAEALTHAVATLPADRLALAAKGDVKDLAQAAVKAIDSASNWQDAATAGGHALDGILQLSGGSPVAFTLQKAVRVQRDGEIGVQILREGLSHPGVLDGTLSAEASVRAMADIGVMSIDKAARLSSTLKSDWTGAAEAGMQAAEHIHKFAFNPDVNEVMKSAWNKPNARSAAFSLRGDLKRIANEGKAPWWKFGSDAAAQGPKVQPEDLMRKITRIDQESQPHL